MPPGLQGSAPLMYTLMHAAAPHLQLCQVVKRVPGGAESIKFSSSQHAAAAAAAGADPDLAGSSSPAPVYLIDDPGACFEFQAARNLVTDQSWVHKEGFQHGQFYGPEHWMYQTVGWGVCWGARG